MAVYTILSDKDFAEILSNCSIGHYIRSEPIEEGVENTNYHLWTDKGRYILSLFEARIDGASLPFVFGLQDGLNKAGISCPEMLHNGTVLGKPWAVISYLAGRSITKPSSLQCQMAGVYLAKLHQAGGKYALKRDNPMGENQWRDLFGMTQKHMNAKQAALVQSILDSKMPALPRGNIHGDYFPDNVFFDEQGEKVTGVIDFYFACTEDYIYDLALAANAWGDGTDLIKGYETVRPLSAVETKYLPLMRRRAALRILLTRLYDWYNTPEGAHVVKKDPDEYWAKLGTL